MPFGEPAPWQPLKEPEHSPVTIEITKTVPYFRSMQTSVYAVFLCLLLLPTLRQGAS